METSVSSSPPIYLNLSKDRREIRLLTLHPSTSKGDIRASLSVVSLYHDPYYEALSYVWGDRTEKPSISLSGLDIKVTKNLYNALGHLRFKEYPRVLWIDALCINQEDLDERGSQVLLMEDIYKGCKTCLLWLGEATKETKATIKIFESWATTGNHLLRSTNFGPEHINAAGELTSRDWFSRTWTVQECVLPKRLVVLCGSETWSWGVFAEAAENLQTHLASPCCISHNDTKNKHMLIINTFIQAISIIENSRYLYPRNRDILTCLNSFRNRKATDARDKIYGLLSLIRPQGQSFIKPNYSDSETAEVVYSRLCVDLINESNSLEPLKYVLGAVDKTIKSLKLPSWVPDWTLPMAEPSWQKGRLDRYPLYNAHGGQRGQPKCITVSESYVLKESGVLCDVVTKVGDERVVNKIPKNWFQLAEVNRIGGREAARSEFWSTILMDTFGTLANGTVTTSLLRASDADYKEYKEWRTRIFDGSSWPAETDRFYYALESATMLRKFFVTKNGHFGIGPGRLEREDKIFILRGGHCPLVLRPDSSTGYYELIGDCYLHGFMDGEAMTDFDSRAISVCIA